MVWVDTNILVRIVTNDVPELATTAISKIRQSRRGELVILDAVLVEFFFVLGTHQPYRFPRAKVAALFEGILKVPQFQISSTAQVAFELYKSHEKLDFTDCLLAAQADGQRENIMTFDKDLLKIMAK